jgi:hypothetical protein
MLLGGLAVGLVLASSPGAFQVPLPQAERALRTQASAAYVAARNRDHEQIRPPRQPASSFVRTGGGATAAPAAHFATATRAVLSNSGMELFDAAQSSELLSMPTLTGSGAFVASSHESTTLQHDALNQFLLAPIATGHGSSRANPLQLVSESNAPAPLTTVPTPGTLALFALGLSAVIAGARRYAPSPARLS